MAVLSTRSLIPLSREHGKSNNICDKWVFGEAESSMAYHNSKRHGLAEEDPKMSRGQPETEAEVL